MSWGGFWAFFERAEFLQHCGADTWVGDEVRRASSGADGRRLLELCSRDSDNFATFFNGKDVAVVFHRRAHTRVQVDLFAGGILCIDA